MAKTSQGNRIFRCYVQKKGKRNINGFGRGDHEI